MIIYVHVCVRTKYIYCFVSDFNMVYVFREDFVGVLRKCFTCCVCMNSAWCSSLDNSSGCSSLWVVFRVLQNNQLIHRMQDEYVELHLNSFYCQNFVPLIYKHAI